MGGREYKYCAICLADGYAVPVISTVQMFKRKVKTGKKICVSKSTGK